MNSNPSPGDGAPLHKGRSADRSKSKGMPPTPRGEELVVFDLDHLLPPVAEIPVLQAD